MMITWLRSTAVALLCFSSVVRGDWGDYADTSFECPAKITCQPVCSSSIDSCPIDLQFCEDNSTTLCVDGSCAANCSEELISPCFGSACGGGANVTCARIVLPQPDCELLYGEWYTANASATSGDDDSICSGEIIELVSFTGPVFVAIYVYFSVVCFLIVAYPAFNQRLFPVGDTVPLDDFSKESVLTGIPAENRGWTQTSVRKTVLGTVLFYLTQSIIWGIQCLLLILLVFYYELGKPNNPFQDEVQVLKAFEIVWMVGLVVSMSLKWPPTVESLFLRRCVSAEATSVAVFSPSTVPELHEVTGNPGIAFIKRIVKGLCRGITVVFAFIFSDPVRRQHHARGSIEYCPVRVDADGTRSFFFRLRRYVYDDQAGRFVPGILDIGSTLGDFQNAEKGLSNAEVVHRRSRIGRNSIDLKKPNLFLGIYEEFSKLFYVYQNFVVWVR